MSVLSQIVFSVQCTFLFSLQQLDQLLGEQSNLCAELGISDWREERGPQNEPPPPNAAASTAAFVPRAVCSKGVSHRPPQRSATVPSSPSACLQRKTELLASPLATGKTNSIADPKEHHTSKKEAKGPSQAKIDFKAFIQNVRMSSFFFWSRKNMEIMFCGKNIGEERTSVHWGWGVTSCSLLYLWISFCLTLLGECVIWMVYLGTQCSVLILPQ